MIDWTQARAPDIDAFARIAEAAFEALPSLFRKRAGSTLIRIQDFAEQEILDDMDLESEFDLLGLYQGVDLISAGADDPGTALVFLYRRPILDLWADGEETLGHIITHVLIHEIGHHFGLSDDDMHAIEDSADAEERGFSR